MMSVSVTVNVSSLGGGLTPGAYILVTLLNCGSSPTVVNTSTPAPITQQFYISNGSVVCTLYDNITQIACEGNMLSYYSFSLVSNGVTTFIKNVELPPGTFNLANLANVTTPPWQAGLLQGPAGEPGLPGGQGPIGPSGTVGFTSANVQQHVAVPSTGFVDKQISSIATYAVDGDGGGGQFVWNSNSTSLPDGGVVLIPSNLTNQIVNQSLATGDGSSTVFSGTLFTSQGIVPASLTGAVGGTTSFSDLGFGLLLNAGVYGTINYTSGAWTLNFCQPWSSTTTYANGTYVWYNGAIWQSFQNSNLNIVPQQTNSISWLFIALSAAAASIPSAGQPITASYQYASTSGRWTRMFSGNVDIRWFGAITGTDIYIPWSKCDYYCFNKGSICYVPAIGSAGWTLNNPVRISANLTTGDTYNTSSTQTTIHFSPPIVFDMLPAVFVNINYQCTVDNLVVIGTDSLPANTQSLVTSGWIITAAEFTGTISGNTLTVSAMISGNIAINQSISGAGMAPAAVGNCVITALGTGTGGTGTYTISGPAQTLSAPTDIVSTTLPNYSAFKVGLAGFGCATSSSWNNCGVRQCKCSFFVSTPFGHVSLQDCNGGNMFGVYIHQNTGDFQINNCAFQGALFASILGGSQGISGDYSGTSIGFGPFGMFQVQDTVSSPTNFGPIIGSIQAEGFGEALIQTHPSSNCSLGELDHPGYNNYAQFILPISLVPVPGTYAYQILGSVSYLSQGQSNIGQGLLASGSIGVAYIGTVSTHNNFQDMQLDSFGGSYTLGPLSYTANKSPNIVFDATKAQRYPERDFLRRSEKSMLAQFASTGNLILNPEIVGNWVPGSGSTVTIVPLNTLLSGALSGFTVPLKAYEVSGWNSNPNVVVITCAAGNHPAASINANSQLVSNISRMICFSCWTATIVTSGTNVIDHSVVGSSTGVYGNNQTIAPNTFSNTQYLGINLADSSQTTITRIVLAGTNTTGQTIYVIAPMLTWDDLAPYSPYAGPTSAEPISISSQLTVAQLTTANAALFAPGTTSFATNGRNTGEAAAAGTGCPVFVKPIAGVNTWCATWSGVAVTA
jgi:hypothetical protein